MNFFTNKNENLILVTGATGNVGQQVVSQLLSTGANVRALTRDPGSADLPKDVEVVRGDLSEPDTLDTPLDGVDAIFLMWPFLTSEGISAVLEVAKEHVRRIVYLSAIGVRDDLEAQADPITQFHADIEQSIEQSGLEWTFVRSGGMATNTLGWAPQIRDGNVVHWIYGNASRSLIHEADVASVAVHALTEDGHEGEKYLVTGPEVLTQIEQVHILGEVIDCSLQFKEISPEAVRKQMRDSGMPGSVADGIIDAHAEFVEESETVTPTVKEITGSPARTFREWANDHSEDFR